MTPKQKNNNGFSLVNPYTRTELTQWINQENTAFEIILLRITARKFYLFVKISASKSHAFFEYLMV